MKYTCDITKASKYSNTHKSYFKEKNIKIGNLNLDDQKITFNVEKDSRQLVIDEFNDENSKINPFYPRFKSHQFELNDLGNSLELKFSNQGLVELKTLSRSTLEIIRRRIDEIGTNEPNILKEEIIDISWATWFRRSYRIKSLLGKTANLTFRFVSTNEDSFGVEKLKHENGIEEDLVSKRIILSGENLLDAQPRMDNQTNETVVTYSW